MKEVSVSDKHQIKIAKSTLKMHDAGAMIMGGMTKDEARRVLKKAGYSDRQIAQMEESTMSKNVFEIKEEVKIGNIILEKGDRIKVIEGFGELGNNFVDIDKLNYNYQLIQRHIDKLSSIAKTFNEQDIMLMLRDVANSAIFTSDSSSAYNYYSIELSKLSYITLNRMNFNVVYNILEREKVIK